MANVFDVQPGFGYLFEFTNHRGEMAERVIFARAMQWGNTPWHPELQWFIHGFDIDKQEVRSFPLKNIRLESFRRATDEELDVALSHKTLEAEKAGYARALAEAEAEK